MDGMTGKILVFIFNNLSWIGQIKNPHFLLACYIKALVINLLLNYSSSIRFLIVSSFSFICLIFKVSHDLFAMLKTKIEKSIHFRLQFFFFLVGSGFYEKSELLLFIVEHVHIGFVSLSKGHI